jgi:hypothetical protein
VKKIGEGNVYDYWLYWKQNSQNVANNTSNVTVKLYLKRNDGYAGSSWRGYNDCTISLTVAGIRRYYTTTANIDTRNSVTVELASWTGDLSHNADGTFTMSMAGSFTFPGTTSLGGTWAISTSAALTTIPRATTPTLSASSVDMGSTVTINLPRASSSFTHKLWYRPSGGAWVVIANNVSTSYVWTVPDLGSNIPNATSLQVEVDVETFNGSTKIGEKSVFMTANIPASYVPTISAVSISEATAGIAAKFAAFVQNKSTLAVAITASGSHGSTIARYETYIQAAAYREASFTSDVITTSGTIGVVTTVTDSRGRIAKVSNSVTVLEYAPPKINSLSAWRIDTSGDASDDGTRIAMAMNFAISSVGEKNDRAYNFKYRKSTDAEFTSFGSGTASTSYDGTQYFTDVPEISPDYAYVVRLEISDYFQTVVYDTQIPTAFTIMDFRSTGKGMAIGKVSERDALEVAMDAIFSKAVTIQGRSLLDLTYPIGSIYMSLSKTNPSDLFGGVWEQIKDVFLLAAGDRYSAGATGGEATHKLTTAEMPSHTHSAAVNGGTDDYGQSRTTIGNFAIKTQGYTDGSTILPTGGGTAHNNMPPYLAVYMWQRIE